MKLLFRVTNKNPVHIYVTVYVNGAYSGLLVLRMAEYTALVALLGLQPGVTFEEV